MLNWLEVGKRAYEAYREKVGNKNFKGDPMPSFADLTETQKRAWGDAAFTGLAYYLSDYTAGRVLAAVALELERATKLYGPIQSAHEAYGIIKEEFDELWNDIKRNDIDHAATEAVQVAAMCVRFIYDMKKEVFHVPARNQADT